MVIVDGMMAKPETLTAAPDNDPVGSMAIQDQLARILASEGFSGSARLQQMLSYVVRETCEGRAKRIKGVTVAQDVFGLRARPKTKLNDSSHL